MQMDICSHVGFSVNDINNLGFCMDALESTCGVVGDFCVDELAYGATKFLNIQDDGVLGSMPPHEEGVFQMQDELGEANHSEIISEDHGKLISISAAASVGGAVRVELNADADAITGEVLTDDENAKSVTPHCSSAPSLPKPVSAMKGSREKCGGSPAKKLRVKWASDVYDPVPTSVLQMVKKRPRKHGKKSKQESKSSRGSSKGKEKKQSRKRGGLKKDEVMIVSEMKASSIDFHVGMPELYCGGSSNSSSSFVNRYASTF